MQISPPSIWLACAVLSSLSLPAAACPFCSAIANTISEDLKTSDVTLVAALSGDAPSAARDEEANLVNGLQLRVFEIRRVLKGRPSLPPMTTRLETTVRGEPVAGQVYLIFGFGEDPMRWSTATALQATSLAYLDVIDSAPEPGPLRLKHFLPYLNHPESAIADDAYNEFARAPYSEVKGLREFLDREDLLRRIQDPKTDARRRRLYFTLLGVCGEPADAAAVLSMMTKLEAATETGLDAAIACYLTLKREAGLPEIAERYFQRDQVDARNLHAAVAALRFHGEEEQLIARRDLSAALQGALRNPARAPLVLPDLARWEDWSALPKVADLFRRAEGRSRHVRPPAVRYLMACPLEEAQTLLAEFEQLDPQSVRQAKSVLPLPPPDDSP